MNPARQQESRQLARSWDQHEVEHLGNYLVTDVEDPRLNLPSILSRHFLLFATFGDRFAQLAAEELRFAAAMNWLLATSKNPGADPAALLHGLREHADNGEGVELPGFVSELFHRPPAVTEGGAIPSYLESALRHAAATGALAWPPAELDVFASLWADALRGLPADQGSLVEPACGSANDYRFLERYGLARLFQYTGVDVSEKNIANARRQFPSVDFQVGNAFELAAPDGAYDFCVVHDLFEHLSPEGVECAVAEVCRVTRRGLSLGFFQMDEIPADVVRPVDEYHWNLLSMEAMRARFAARGFGVQVIHIGTFLRARTGCRATHNPNAYTFLLGREPAPSAAPVAAGPTLDAPGNVV